MSLSQTELSVQGLSKLRVSFCFSPIKDGYAVDTIEPERDDVIEALPLSGPLDLKRCFKSLLQNPLKGSWEIRLPRLQWLVRLIQFGSKRNS